MNPFDENLSVVNERMTRFTEERKWSIGGDAKSLGSFVLQEERGRTFASNNVMIN